MIWVVTVISGVCVVGLLYVIWKSDHCDCGGRLTRLPDANRWCPRCRRVNPPTWMPVD